MNDQTRPGVIGIFDSGIGGISILGRIREQLPNQPLVYLADQGNAPYGSQTLDQVRVHARDATRMLLGRGADVIVIACNTASAAALYELRNEFVDVPFVGMEPAVKPAVAGSRTRKIGVLATEATFQGELYANVVDRHATGAVVVAQACPGLADLVERGDLEGPRAIELVSSFVEPLIKSGVDTLVLGCTHYAFVADLIASIAGPDIEIIDPAEAIARQVGRVLAERNLIGEEPTNDVSYITTGDTGVFDNQLEWLAKHLAR
ncbi:MAG: glutamate racemase [Acidimicrobiia bacterium]|nr:glutamate racemase [Acidimicrobiia bacterium]NNL27263.1 glutamate racemase [Acidimicrobiia bacterium]